MNLTGSFQPQLLKSRKSGLSPNGEYKVKVKSKCSGGNNSEYTEWLFFNAVANSTTSVDTCATPWNLMATDITDSTAVLNWQMVPGAQSYILQFEAFGDTICQKFKISITSPSLPVFDLFSETEYRFRVVADCAEVGESTYSDWFYFVTLENDEFVHNQPDQNQQQISTFEIYPNPSLDLINLQINTNLRERVEQVEIYNLNGVLQKIIQQPIFENNILIVNIADLDAGMYLASIKLMNSGVHSKRFVVNLN